MMGYWSALALTVLVEVPIVAALFPRQRVLLAAASAAATTVTHALMYFAFPRLLPPAVSALVFGELFATAFEAVVYAAASSNVSRAMIASALANSVSFGAGLLVLGGPPLG